MCVEIIKKGSVSEVEQPRGRIRHDVAFSRDEGELGAVAVVSLVFAGSLAQVCSRPRSGGSPLKHSGESGGVVRECADGLFPDV